MTRHDDRSLAWILFSCIAIVVAAFLIVELGGCSSFADTSARTLNSIKAGTDSVQTVSAPIFHLRCLSIAKKCGVPAAQCDSLKRCQQSRAAFNKRLTQAYSLLDVARILHGTYAATDGADDVKTKIQAAVVKLLSEYYALIKDAQSLGVMK